MRDFLVDIDSEHFDNYFQNEIVPYLSESEAERKKTNKLDKYIWPVVTPLFFLGLIIGALWEFDADSLLYSILPENIVDAIIIVSTIALIFSICFFRFYDRVFFSKRKSVEAFLYNKLLSYIGDFRHEAKGSLFSSKNEIKSRIHDLYLFGKINNLYCYDSVYGVLNGKQIDICEIKLTPKEMIDDLLCKECRGVFISSSTDLNLSDFITIAKKDSRAKIKLNKDVMLFKTENKSFNKLFNVYTTNVSQAKKILSQDFVKQFLDAYYELGLSISCAFVNNKLYMLILNNKKIYKDWFSFENCKKSYLDKSNYKGLLNDVLDVLKLVDTIQRIAK